MYQERSNTQMFKLVTATVDNEWLKAKMISKYDFLDSIQKKGCKVVLEKSSIRIECSFDQLQELHRTYEDDNDDDDEVNKSQDNVAEAQHPGLFDATLVTDKIILDGYMWDYMDQIYGSEILIMKEKHKVSIETGKVKNGLVTITLKAKDLRIPVDVMAAQEQLLEMKEYISTLQSFVLSSVSVECVNVGRLEKSHFQDMCNYLEAKYGNVILKRTNNGFRIIGPSDSCDAIKKRFDKTPVLPVLSPPKRFEINKASNKNYLHSGKVANENFDFDQFMEIPKENKEDQDLIIGEEIDTLLLSEESKAEEEPSDNIDLESEEPTDFVIGIDSPSYRLQTQEAKVSSDDEDDSNDTSIFENAKSELYPSFGESTMLDKYTAEEFEQGMNNLQTSGISFSTKHYETDQHDEDLENTYDAEIVMPKRARKKLPNIAYITYLTDAKKKTEVRVKKTPKCEAKEKLKYDSHSDYSD